MYPPADIMQTRHGRRTTSTSPVPAHRISPTTRTTGTSSAPANTVCVASVALPRQTTHGQPSPSPNPGAGHQPPGTRRRTTSPRPTAKCEQLLAGETTLNFIAITRLTERQHALQQQVTASILRTSSGTTQRPPTALTPLNCPEDTRNTTTHPQLAGERPQVRNNKNTQHSSVRDRTVIIQTRSSDTHPPRDRCR